MSGQERPVLEWFFLEILFAPSEYSTSCAHGGNQVDGSLASWVVNQSDDDVNVFEVTNEILGPLAGIHVDVYDQGPSRFHWTKRKL